MKFLKVSRILFVLATVFLSAIVNAHHSYSIYDIDNKITRSGVLSKLQFIQPHIKMTVTVTTEGGSNEIWEIASMGPSLWDRNGHDRDFAAIGDKVTIEGWPARNGKDEMALSTITSQKSGKMVIRDIVRQRGARDNLPETIKRD